jgi:hypothetical protein
VSGQSPPPAEPESPDAAGISLTPRAALVDATIHDGTGSHPRMAPPAFAFGDTGPVPGAAPASRPSEAPSGPSPRAHRPPRVRVGVAWPAWGPEIRLGELEQGPALSRQVLVRVRDLNPNSAAGRAWLLRLRDTRHVLGAAPPPGVLNLLHSSPAGARIAEVYEGFRGASVAQVLGGLRSVSRGLPVRLGVQIAARVAQVAAAVERLGGLVHPGFCPDQVLIDARGEVRVAGFLSRPANIPPLTSDDPLREAWHGVEGYVPVAGPGAPEAMSMSIGALLLELLSGERPPPVQADRARLRRQMVRAFARPGEVIPDDVIALVHECFSGAPTGSLGALAARLDSVERVIEGPLLSDWAGAVVGAVIAGRPPEPDERVAPPPALDRSSITLASDPGLSARRAPNLKEGLTPEEALTVVEPAPPAAAAPVVGEPVAASPELLEALRNPTARGGLPGSPEAALVGLSDAGRTVLQRAPATRAGPWVWLATSLVVLVSLIVAFLLVDRLAAMRAAERGLTDRLPPAAARPAQVAPPRMTAGEAQAPSAASGSASPSTVSPSAASPSAVSPPSVSPPSVSPSSVSPSSVAPTPAEGPTPAGAPAPSTQEAGAAAGGPSTPTDPAGAAPLPAPSAAPGAPPRPAPTSAAEGAAAQADGAAVPGDERFTVRFRAPDPDVDAIRVTCKGGISEQGTREVKISGVPAVACQVTVRRGPQSSAASVIVSGSRTYECFSGGSAVCR